MVVEERGLADVAHLPHAAHRPLPGDGLVSTHVEGEAGALLLHHLTELVADQPEDVFGFSNVGTRGPHLVRREQRQLRGLGVRRGIEIP